MNKNSRKKIYFLIILLILSCSHKKERLDGQKDWPLKDLDLKNVEQKIKFLDSVTGDREINAEKARNTNIYLNIALEYYDLNEMQKSNSASRFALKLAESNKDSLFIAKALFYIGDSYRFSQRDSAYYFYFQAEKIYQKVQDKDNVALMQYNKALVLFYDGNYIECEVQLSKALQILKDSKDYYLLYSCNSLLGICLEKVGDYDEALLYHTNAAHNITKLAVSEEEKSSYQVSTAINISNLYDIQKHYDKSIVNLQSILNEDLKTNNPLSYARVLSNLAYSKFQNGESAGVENMFLQSIRIADSIGNDSDLLYKYIYFGEFNASEKDTLAAVKYIKLANKIAVKNSNTNEILCTLKLLTKIDKLHSLKYSADYIKISDSSQALQKKTRNKYARIEYETTKIQDANKKLSRNNIIIITAASIFIAILLILIIIRYIKYKNKELHFLRMQEKANEDVFTLLTEQQQRINQAKEVEKTKIAQELHDGIINTLYGIRLNLGFFNSKVDESAVEKRKDYIEELKKVEGEIRTISHELSRTKFFDTSDFNMLLEGLIQNQEGISKTTFSYLNSENSDWTEIPNLYKINIYRIIQEAVLNVNKYAKAQNCIITFQRENSTIRILIQDDGIGFDVSMKRNGIGHNNMNSRIKSIGGTIQIISEIGKGTTIEINIDSSLFQNSSNNIKRRK